MNPIASYLLNEKLNKLSYNKRTHTWNNSSIISSNDVIHYFNKWISSNLIIYDKKKIGFIDIRHITGICHVSTDAEYIDITSFQQILNDSKGQDLIDRTDAIESFKQELLKSICDIHIDTWSKKIFINLGNGNHRFTILRKNAIENNYQILLNSNLYIASIDINFFNKIESKYSFYIISEDLKNDLINLDIQYRNTYNTFIRYPVIEEYICINKSKIGQIVSNHIESKKGAINILNEVRKYIITG